MHMLLRYLRRAAYFQDEGQLTDGQLLELFLAQREETAFEELVRRHGPMVLGVCRRVLHNEHDVEDAFQATFLVLVRKADSVQPRELVGHWLYGVAYRTALRAKALDAKRREKEKAMPRPPDHSNGVWQDVLPLLDQEVCGLPKKYRIPVVLCDLQGKSRKEVASVLGWSEGTLSSRLARARALLGRRLTRRGVALSGGALAELVSTNGASACVPPPLLISTMKAAILVAAGQAATAACASFHAAALTEGVIRNMLFAKLKTTALLCAVAALAIGAGGVVYKVQAGKGNPADPVQDQGRPKLVKAEGRDGDSRRAAQKAEVQPKDVQQAPDTDLPSDAAKRIRDLEVEVEAIRKKADTEIQTRRDKLLADLQALQNRYTRAGKLDEAVAIRKRIRELKAASEKAHNRLVNGSFEEGPPTPNDGVHNMRDLAKGSTAIKGWVVTRPVAIPIDSAYWRPADGKRSLTVNRMGGAISQSFKTKKGQKYCVSFWLAGDPHGGPKNRQLQISAAGKSAKFVFDMTGKNRVDMGWVRKSWEFTAESTKTTLEFSCLTEGIFGVALDDVVVVAVNE
jgi:RNA polymerase sigma factor (sigma-70 family)